MLPWKMWQPCTKSTNKAAQHLPNFADKQYLFGTGKYNRTYTSSLLHTYCWQCKGGLLESQKLSGVQMVIASQIPLSSFQSLWLSSDRCLCHHQEHHLSLVLHKKSTIHIFPCLPTIMEGSPILLVPLLSSHLVGASEINHGQHILHFYDCGSLGKLTSRLLFRHLTTFQML